MVTTPVKVGDAKGAFPFSAVLIHVNEVLIAVRVSFSSVVSGICGTCAAAEATDNNATAASRFIT
jgi:hypothetical protein